MRYEALLTLTLKDVTSHQRDKFYEKLEEDFDWDKEPCTETTWSKSKRAPSKELVSEAIIDSFIKEIKEELSAAASHAELGLLDYHAAFTVGLGKTERA